MNILKNALTILNKEGRVLKNDGKLLKNEGSWCKAKEIQVKIKFTATRIDIVGAVYSIRVGHTMHRYIYI